MSLAHKQRLYYERKESGLCVKCGEPAGGFVMCPEHRVKQAVIHRKWTNLSAQASYQQRKAEGLCVSCGEKLTPDDATIRCEECRQDAKARIEARRAAGLPGPRPPHAGESPRWRELVATERCSCGLLKPCNQCLPSVYEVASSRRGTATYPEGGGA